MGIPTISNDHSPENILFSWQACVCGVPFWLWRIYSLWGLLSDHWLQGIATFAIHYRWPRWLWKCFAPLSLSLISPCNRQYGWSFSAMLIHRLCWCLLLKRSLSDLHTTSGRDTRTHHPDCRFPTSYLHDGIIKYWRATIPSDHIILLPYYLPAVLYRMRVSKLKGAEVIGLEEASRLERYSNLQVWTREGGYVRISRIEWMRRDLWPTPLTIVRSIGTRGKGEDLVTYIRGLLGC